MSEIQRTELKSIAEQIPGTEEAGFLTRQDNPGHGKLSVHDKGLFKVLELCCMYLVALDAQFSSTEQDWVDEHFGPDSANRFIAETKVIDWEICFSEIATRLNQLKAVDQQFMKTHSRSLFQSLLKSDNVEEVEQERLDHLMNYISESLDME